MAIGREGALLAPRRLARGRATPRGIVAGVRVLVGGRHGHGQGEGWAGGRSRTRCGAGGWRRGWRRRVKRRHGGGQAAEGWDDWAKAGGSKESKPQLATRANRQRSQVRKELVPQERRPLRPASGLSLSEDGRASSLIARRPAARALPPPWSLDAQPLPMSRFVRAGLSEDLTLSSGAPLTPLASQCPR